MLFATAAQLLLHTLPAGVFGPHAEQITSSRAGADEFRWRCPELMSRCRRGPCNAGHHGSPPRPARRHAEQHGRQWQQDGWCPPRDVGAGELPAGGGRNVARLGPCRPSTSRPTGQSG